MEIQREEYRQPSETSSISLPNKLYHPLSQTEIDERLKRRYLDRLVDRVKKLRKLIVERKWEELRLECGQLAVSSSTFGFENLKSLACMAQESIPVGKISRPAAPVHAKKNVETLIATIDSILMDHERS